MTRTRTITLPDMTDRYGGPNPPDGYTVIYSGVDGYYLAKQPFRTLTINNANGSPYNVGSEEIVLVQSHAGSFTVNLPVSPIIGTAVFVKDFAGVAAANNIIVSSAALIDGSPNFTINSNLGAVRVVFNGSTWSILSKL